MTGSDKSLQLLLVEGGSFLIATTDTSCDLDSSSQAADFLRALKWMFCCFGIFAHTPVLNTFTNFLELFSRCCQNVMCASGRHSSLQLQKWVTPHTDTYAVCCRCPGCLHSTQGTGPEKRDPSLLLSKIHSIADLH